VIKKTQVAAKVQRLCGVLEGYHCLLQRYGEFLYFGIEIYIKMHTK